MTDRINEIRERVLTDDELAGIRKELAEYLEEIKRE